MKKRKLQEAKVMHVVRNADTNGNTHIARDARNLHVSSQNTPDDDLGSRLVKNHSSGLQHTDTFDGCEVELYTLEGYSTTSESTHSSTTASAAGRTTLAGASTNSRHSSADIPALTKTLTHESRVAVAPAERSEIYGGLQMRKDTNELLQGMKSLNISMKIVRRASNEIIETLSTLKGNPAKPNLTRSPPSATTLEELGQLAKSPSLVKELSALKGLSLRDTTRRMLHRIMKKNLALQFSYSGLGEKRQPSKHALKTHAIYQPITDALLACGYEDRIEITRGVQDILRHAKNWPSLTSDGGPAAAGGPAAGGSPAAGGGPAAALGPAAAPGSAADGGPAAVPSPVANGPKIIDGIGAAVHPAVSAVCAMGNQKSDHGKLEMFD